MSNVDRYSFTVPRKSFRDLRVWQEAIALTKLVYHTTADFPKEERFGLVLQLRKSSVSIASNIAEGCARNGAKEFIQFLGISKGSTAELITQVVIAYEVGLIGKEDYEILLAQAQTVSKMLSGLKGKIASGVSHLAVVQPTRNEQTTVNE